MLKIQQILGLRTTHPERSNSLNRDILTRPLIRQSKTVASDEILTRDVPPQFSIENSGLKACATNGEMRFMS